MALSQEQRNQIVWRVVEIEQAVQRNKELSGDPMEKTRLSEEWVFLQRRLDPTECECCK